ncbi:MAG: acyltransferase family protein [Pantoea sp.]|uniref:acyltransferase family protein n=1 Tax=Pantoea sp. TaxID=69393 RepID=UPI0039E2B108
MNFRADINGLRAYAVILVLLYHVGVSGISGGFLGVDIFFVISGYLMTGIILSRLQQQRFSLSGFYASRCRRIIPPLMAMCAILLMVGYFLIPPDEYKTLSGHIAASLSFISNLVYFKEAGYFDAGSMYKWLLHTWSLSVEWQFYLLLPLALMFTARYLRRQFGWVMAIGAVLSFALALVVTHLHDTLAYFMLPTRAWEMLAGGLVYLAPNSRLTGQRWVILPALLGLIASAMWIDAGTTWPGVMTLIPVVLTALIIHVTANDSPLLNNRVVQPIGKASYSIYLWHWPLWVFWHLADLPVTPVSQAVLITLSLLLGGLSWALVENKAGLLSATTPVALGNAALLLLAALLIVAQQGFPARAPQSVSQISQYAKQRFTAARGCLVVNSKQSPQCTFGEGNEVNLVVLGDSHANALLSSVVASGNAASDAVVFIAQSGCPTVPDINRPGRPDCGDFVKNALTTIEEKYPQASVLIINRFSLYLHGENGSSDDIPQYTFANEVSSLTSFQKHFTRAVKKLATHRKVFIMTPVPEFDYDVIYRMTRDAMRGKPFAIQLPREEYLARNQDALRMLHQVVAEIPNVTLLDATQALCDNYFCYGARGEVPLYRDSNHLSEFGNKMLGEIFAGMWRRINGESGVTVLPPQYAAAEISRTF